MKLFDYLDHHYRCLNVECQKDWSIKKEAKLKAAYELIQWQRKVWKAFWMPTLMFQFLLVKCKLLNPPLLTPPVIEPKSDSALNVPKSEVQ